MADDNGIREFHKLFFPIILLETNSTMTELALHYIYHGWQREKYKNLQHKRASLEVPSVQRSYGIRQLICKLNISGSSYGPVVGSCELTDALQCGEFLGQLRDYRILEDVSKIQYLIIKCLTYITSNHRAAVNSDWGKCANELTVLCLMKSTRQLTSRGRDYYLCVMRHSSRRKSNLRISR